MAPVEALLVTLPTRTRSLLRLGLRAFEYSPFPRRFSRLSIERRRVRIERLAQGRWSLGRDLTLLLKMLACLGYTSDARVRAASGWEPGCELADPTPPCEAPPALDPEAMAVPDDVERCDVAIVGSGAGGAAAARLLAEAGLDVVVVEQGEYHDGADYPADPIAAMAQLYRDGGLTVCEGRPSIPVPVGRCVGGTTVINSGTCLRAPDDVLLGWREQHGVGWATELDGRFEAVERALGVTPVDPATAGRNAALCRLGAEAIGASNRPITRNAPPLRRCASCATGCPLDAKRAMHVSELPAAVAAGARIRAGVRVERIVIERDRAVGVAGTVNGQGRRSWELRARAVVLAAGALGTPELLLRQGIGNRSGTLGRGLRIHPASWVGARYDEAVRGWEGVMQSWLVDEWIDRGLFLEATFTPLAFAAPALPGVGAELSARIEAFDRLGVIGVHLSDRSEGRVRPSGSSLRMSYKLERDDAATLRFGIARAAEIHFAAGAREVYPPLARLPVLRPGEQVDLIERGRWSPGELRLEGFHPMGTARIGADPRRSVVAPSGECHDLAGLYIADASLFPTSVKANPMLTIMACAQQIATGIAARLA